MNCRHCGAPIKYRKLSRGWLHAGPLGELRVSHWEAHDIYADPPRPGQVLHRQTVLHPAEPKRALTAAEVEERMNGKL